MGDISIALFWSGPIGVGAFLAGLGVFFWGMSKIVDVDRKKKEQERPRS